jgi:hypothetical protein
MSVQRDLTAVTDDTQPIVAQPVVQPVAAVWTEPTGEPHVVRTVAAETVQVRSSMTVSPASVVACVASIILLLFGALNLARAGLDGPLRDPVVEVAGYAGTAVLGLIALGLGLAMLAAAFSRDRGTIIFVSVVLGVSAATLALEPSVGGDLIAAESDFGVAVLIIAVFVGFVAAVAPSVRRTSNRLERVA